MRVNIRRAALLLLASAIVSVAPISGHAEGYCDSNFFFFGSSKIVTPAGPSATAGNPIAYSAAYCIVDSSDTLGEVPNQLLPINNQFYVRYTTDLGEGTPSIDVVLDGAGFSAQVVTLKRVPLTGGTAFAYDGPVLPITGTGCIRVTSEELEEAGHIATFGAACA